MHIFYAVAAGYFAVNLLCALVLHFHSLQQAHLKLRFLDVLLHFLLMSALALPVLLVTTGEALFGHDRRVAAAGYGAVAQHR